MTETTQMQRIQRILATSFLGLLLVAGAPGTVDAQAHQADVRERLYSSDLIEETLEAESPAVERAVRTDAARAPLAAGVHQKDVLARLYRFDRIETSPAASPGRGARGDSLLARGLHPWNSGPHQANVRERLYSRDLMVAPWVRLAASPAGGEDTSGDSDR